MAQARDQSKARKWRRLIEEQKKSGQSVTDYCRQRRIPVSQFYWWQRQLRQRDGEAQPRPASDRQRFIPVRLPAVLPVVEVVHPGGCVVRLPIGLDPQVLRAVLDALDPAEA
jgi:hypothetical protein